VGRLYAYITLGNNNNNNIKYIYIYIYTGILLSAYLSTCIPVCLIPNVLWYINEHSVADADRNMRGRIYILLSAVGAGATRWRRNVLITRQVSHHLWRRRVRNIWFSGATRWVGIYIIYIYIYYVGFYVLLYRISIMYLCAAAAAAVYDGGTQVTAELWMRGKKNTERHFLWLMAKAGTAVNDVGGVMCYNIILLLTCCVANWRSRLIFLFLGRQSGREKKIIREPAGSAQPGDHRGLSARVSRGPSYSLLARTRPATVEALSGLNRYLYHGYIIVVVPPRDRCV